jgi:hypothetical protein
MRARFSVRILRALRDLLTHLFVERVTLALLLWAFVGAVAGIRGLQYGRSLLRVDGDTQLSNILRRVECLDRKDNERCHRPITRYLPHIA